MLSGASRPARNGRYLRIGQQGTVSHQLAAHDPATGIYRIVVRGGLAADQRLAQTRHGVDHQQVPPCADRIRGEYHPGRPGVHHALDHHVHYQLVAARLVLLVLPRALTDDRGGAAIDCPLQLRKPLHIEHSIVLAGKGRIAAIFPERRGAHGNRAATQRAIVAFEIFRVLTNPRVANNEAGRYRQLHGQQPGQALCLAAGTRIADLSQFEDICGHRHLCR